LLISAYILILAWFNIGSVASDPLEQAAEQACENLISTTVFDSAFGRIGICDLPEESTAKTRSLNTLLSLVRQGIWSSEQYHLPAMQQLAKSDLALLRKLQEELRSKLVNEISENGPTYNQVHRILSRSAHPGSRLTFMAMELGAIDNHKEGCFDSDIEARPDEQKAAYVRDGKLLAMTPVAVPFSTPIFLHQQASKATIVTPSNFIACKNAVPTAILITAEYESKEGKGEG